MRNIRERERERAKKTQREDQERIWQREPREKHCPNGWVRVICQSKPAGKKALRLERFRVGVGVREPERSQDANTTLSQVLARA